MKGSEVDRRLTVFRPSLTDPSTAFHLRVPRSTVRTPSSKMLSCRSSGLVKDENKWKRKLSNRESACRSRMRKLLLMFMSKPPTLLTMYATGSAVPDFVGKQLEDGQTLANYNIQKGKHGACFRQQNQIKHHIQIPGCCGCKN